MTAVKRPSALVCCECCKQPYPTDPTGRTVCDDCYERHGYDFDPACPKRQNDQEPGRAPSGHCLGCGTLARSVHYPGCWVSGSVLQAPAQNDQEQGR